MNLVAATALMEIKLIESTMSLWRYLLDCLGIGESKANRKKRVQAALDTLKLDLLPIEQIEDMLREFEDTEQLKRLTNSQGPLFEAACRYAETHNCGHAVCAEALYLIAEAAPLPLGSRIVCLREVGRVHPELNWEQRLRSALDDLLLTSFA